MADIWEPITVTVARDVEFGREQDFEEWASGILNEASKFRGFLGAGILKPGSNDKTWHIVYRFKDQVSLRDWENSSVRGEWLSKADAIMEETARHRVSGLETWFELPGRTAKAPPRRKMAVVTLLAIYPIVLVYGTLARGISWPFPIRAALQVGVLVILMTWVVMPRMTRWFSTWLYPK
jgi:antibiotic biosynthesis monooxygenase (ABM) superfamily enzyme